MLRIFIILLLLSCGCSSVRPSWMEPGVNGEENLGGHFEGEVWVPDNPSIEWTYRMPDLSAGMVYDVRSEDVTPTLQVELVEFDIPARWPLNTWKIDGGVGYQRIYGYTGVLLTNIFEISVGVAGGWNFDDNTWFVGPSFTVIKF